MNSTTNRALRSRRRQSGFTLAELAIVTVIIALLLGGTMLTFQAQSDARDVADSRRSVEQAKDAIIGFAIRNGRLPCPAAAASNGLESFCVEAVAPGPCTPTTAPTTAVLTHGRCSSPTGFVPAATLGIGPVQVNPSGTVIAPGTLIDSWQQPVRYVVTQIDALPVAGPPPLPAVTRPFTSAGGLRQIALRNPPFVPDLAVCAQGTGLTPGFADAGCNAAVTSFATAAVLFSTGKNFTIAGAAGADDQENLDGDVVFVANEATPGRDDVVSWLSTNILFNRLIAAGAI